MDCAGYTISGDGGAPDNGIFSNGGWYNTTVKNCVIENFGTGVLFTHSSNVTIFNNTIGHINLTEPDIGISFTNASGANISNNIVTNISANDTDNPSGIVYVEAPGSSVNNSVISGNNVSGIYGADGFFSIGIKIGDPNILDLDALEVSNNVIENILCTSLTGDCGLYNGGVGIVTLSGTNVNITNNNITGSGIGLIPNYPGLQITKNYFSSNTAGIGTLYLGSTAKFNHSLIENNTFDSMVAAGMNLQNPVFNNTFLNNNFSNNPTDIVDDSTEVNYLIYNNSFGEIRWDALRNMTIAGGGLALGKNLLIGDNIAAFNSSGMANLNGSANITLNNLSFINITEIYRVNNYSTTSAKVSSTGTDCNSTSCSTLTYTSNNLLFNTSNFSSFSANGSFDDPPVVTLNSPSASNVSESAVPANYTFNCSATDDIQLVNMSLYITNPSNSSFAFNQSTTITGTTNTTNWTLSLGVGNYTWNCLAFDNISNSSFATSNRSIALTELSASVSNAPNVTQPVITPTTAYTNDTLTANTTYNDTGGSSSATVYFLWYLNGTNIYNQTNASIANGTTVITSLNSNNFSKDDLINVSVYANNTSAVSDTLWSTVLTISNLAPEASSVNISSSDSLNRSNGTLTGTFTYTDTDNDLQASNETEWYNGSTKVDNLDNFTSIASGNLSKSEVWIFSVRVNDSTNFSSWTNSSSITIGNAAPVFDQNLTNQSVEFANEFNFDVNCSDGDGETITYYDNTSLFNINSSNGYINDTSTISEIGNYTINISCDDGTVNTSQTFIYSIVDTTVPTIIITAVAPNNGSVVDFNLTTNENATCQYKNNSNSFANMNETGNITHFQNVTNLSAGDHQYNFSCLDNSSNAATATLNFVVTTTTTLNQSSTSLNLTGNVSSTVNVISGVNLTFNVSTTLGENISVSVAEYNETPLTTNFSVTGSTVTEYKYYVIDAPSITESINWITLKFTYNETEVVAAGIAEADLSIFFYNTTSSAWQEETSVVNTAGNYIEANVSHLSTFVLGKSTATAAAAAASSSTSSSSSSTGANAWGLCGDGLCNNGLTCAPDINTNNDNGACYKDCGLCSDTDKDTITELDDQKAETAEESEIVDSATTSEENIIDTVAEALVGKAWAGYKTVIFDLTWLWIGLIVLFVIGWLGAYTHHKNIIRTERKKVKIHFGEDVKHLESNFKVFFSNHKDIFKVIFKVLLVILILTGLGLAAYLVYPYIAGENGQGVVVADEVTIGQEVAVIEESATAGSEEVVKETVTEEGTVTSKFAHALSGQAWGRYKTVFLDLTWLWIGLVILFVIGWFGAYTHHKNILRTERKKVKINFGEDVRHLEDNLKDFFKRNKEIFLVIFKILLIVAVLFGLGLATYFVYSYFTSENIPEAVIVNEAVVIEEAIMVEESSGAFSFSTIFSFVKTISAKVIGLGIWLIPLTVLLISMISLIIFHFYKKRK